MRTIRFLVAAALGSFSLSAFGAEFYAAPDGKFSNNGSKDKPWSLVRALAESPTVKPGDTVWLRGGTYTGHFTSGLNGAPDKPIVVRPFPGERAVIDGNYGGNQPTLIIRGSYTWYWGFEVTNSSPERTGSSATFPSTPLRGEGVDLVGQGTKAINLVIHDCAQGILTTSSVQDTEAYGNVIYYNGYDAPDRGHGHGIYFQNAGPLTRTVADNIFFGQYDISIHAYTTSGTLDDLDIEGNTSFGAGILSHAGPTLEVVVGATGSAAADPTDTKVAKNTTFKSNYVYTTTTAVNLGYSKGIASPTIVDNYIVGRTALAFVNVFRPITMTGNLLYGSLAGLQAGDFSNNTFYSARPTGTKVFVRPNKYEPGRANITIFNWDKTPTVSVDLGVAVPKGTRFELRSVHNFFGPPVLTGTYDGTPLQVPMTNLTAAAPVGAPAPTSISPEFQAFVLLPVPPPLVPRAEVRPPRDAPRSPMVVRRQDAAASSSSAGYARTSAVRYFPVSSAVEEPATLELSNPGAAPATVDVRVLERDRDNTAVVSRDILLAPRDVVRIRDPLATLGAAVPEGVLEVRLAGPAEVRLRAQEDDAAAGVPVRLVPWIAREQLSRSRELVGVRKEHDGDAEIVLLNPNAESASITLTLLEGGATLGQTVRPVPPNGFTTASLTDLFPEAEIPRDEALTIAVDAGALPVYAAARTRAASATISSR